MRRAAKIDSNQTEIVKALRGIPGCEVESLAAVGGGVPDILIGYQGVNILAEIKDGKKIPSAQKLTPDQNGWHKNWPGQVSIVNSVDAAINLVLSAQNTTPSQN